MKEYKFLVGLCGGWCDGTLTIKANNDDEAYNNACDTVVKRLVDAFPELEIDYDVEPFEEELCEERCETCSQWERGSGIGGVCMRYASVTRGNEPGCPHWRPWE